MPIYLIFFSSAPPKKPAAFVVSHMTTSPILFGLIKLLSYSSENFLSMDGDGVWRVFHVYVCLSDSVSE